MIILKVQIKIKLIKVVIKVLMIKIKNNHFPNKKITKI